MRRQKIGLRSDEIYLIRSGRLLKPRVVLFKA
jgi:hypothetical protein